MAATIVTTVVPSHAAFRSPDRISVQVLKGSVPQSELNTVVVYTSSDTKGRTAQLQTVANGRWVTIARLSDPRGTGLRATLATSRVGRARLRAVVNPTAEYAGGTSREFAVTVEPRLAGSLLVTTGPYGADNSLQQFGILANEPGRPTRQRLLAPMTEASPSRVPVQTTPRGLLVDSTPSSDRTTHVFGYMNSRGALQNLYSTKGQCLDGGATRDGRYIVTLRAARVESHGSFGLCRGGGALEVFDTVTRTTRVVTGLPYFSSGTGSHMPDIVMGASDRYFTISGHTSPEGTFTDFRSIPVDAASATPVTFNNIPADEFAGYTIVPVPGETSTQVVAFGPPKIDQSGNVIDPRRLLTLDASTSAAPSDSPLQRDGLMSVAQSQGGRIATVRLVNGTPHLFVSAAGYADERDLGPTGYGSSVAHRAKWAGETYIHVDHRERNSSRPYATLRRASDGVVVERNIENITTPA